MQPAGLIPLKSPWKVIHIFMTRRWPIVVHSYGCKYGVIHFSISFKFRPCCPPFAPLFVAGETYSLTYYRVLPDSSVKGDMKTHVIDGDISRTPEEGAHTPSWPNGLLIIIIIIIIIMIINMHMPVNCTVLHI
jgi:hypothetical protein